MGTGGRYCRPLHRRQGLWSSTARVDSEGVLTPVDVVLGWYQNPPPWERTDVVLTNRGILYYDEGPVTYIPYNQIRGCEHSRIKAGIIGVSLETPQAIAFFAYGGRKRRRRTLQGCLGLCPARPGTASSRERSKRIVTVRERSA